MTLQEQFEKETGKKALYRMNSSDYHTLKYVRWLEKRCMETESKLDKITSLVDDDTLMKVGM